MVMESLSIVISSSPPLHHHQNKNQNQNHRKTHKAKTTCLLPTYHHQLSSTSKAKTPPQNPTTTTTTTTSPLQIQKNSISTSSYILLANQLLSCCLAAPPPCLAATEVDDQKINLEALLISVDDFFNRYPFFVAGVTFIWLVVLPLTQEYLKKYKFISAIDAFRKLKDDSTSNLLDIRDKKSLAFLGSPNLKIFNKTVQQIHFSVGDGDEDEEQGFVNKVLQNFPDPANTIICVIDNFDGNSMKVAELLFKNGFKEAYAIKDGVRGKNGWQAIQENLLPPSVHIYPKSRNKMPQQLKVNGVVNQQSEDSYVDGSQKTGNIYMKQSIELKPHAKLQTKSSSPYPNYPDLKPPSSPTPAKPRT